MSEKVAIVGIETIIGPHEGRNVYNRSIFDCIEPAAPASADPPRKLRVGTRSRAKEGYFRILDDTHPRTPGWLLDKAVAGAILDTPSSEQVPEAECALLVVSDRDLSDCQNTLKAFPPVASLSLALQRTRDMLLRDEAPAVLIAATLEGPSDTRPAPNGLKPGEGACAVCLKRLDRAVASGDRIYAVLDALAFDPGVPSSEGVARVCREALATAGIDPGQVGYIEVSCQGVDEDRTETEGLAGGYHQTPGQTPYDVPGDLTCALGSGKDGLGSRVAPGAALPALIRTVFTLYHRYIPATPRWTGPRHPELWEGTPFYVAMESRPWFTDDARPKRIAALNCMDAEGVAHVILSENTTRQPRPNSYLSLVSPYLFPVAGEDQADLAARLDRLERAITAHPGLPFLAMENLDAFQRQPDAPYAMVIAAYEKDELLSEIQFMRKGMAATFANQTQLRTPNGSYFTANPLGREGQVAFVYPGVGSAYVGLGQGLFQLIPEVFDQVSEMTPDTGRLLKERDLYPRSREPLDDKQLWKKELQMRQDILTIGESGMAFYGLYTMILRDVFKVMPDCAMGYSMGEPGMVASLGAWEEPLQLTDRFSNSPVFRTRLNGELEAVREHWKLGRNGSGPQGRIWDCYTLRVPADVAREAIRDEERVFVTIINTPGEVVIAGDPAGCLRVAKKLDCKYYPLGLNLAIHAPPARLEYQRLADLYSLPTNVNPGVRFYSSSCYKPVPVRTRAVAHSIARAFCEPVDFPRLVNRTYDDGARIFIELGSRKFCCNLIEKILEGRDHLAIPINVKGTKDQTSMVRVLTQLVSHRVPADLSPLF